MREINGQIYGRKGRKRYDESDCGSGYKLGDWV